MFQVTCPKCQQSIKSPLLVESETIDCSHCRETVDVRDVVVSTRSFSIHRKDLLKRLPLYKKLLNEVEKELSAMDRDESISARSRESVEKFRFFLKDLLLGARDSFRMSLPQHVFIEIYFEKGKRLARLENLSVAGAAVEFLERGSLPHKSSEVTVHMLLPGHDDPLSIPAAIAWVKKQQDDHSAEKVYMGLKFEDPKEKVRSCIRDFIMDSVSSGVAERQG